MKILLSAATAVALTAVAGCSGDDDGDTATDPASTPTSGESTSAPAVAEYPQFEPADYSFVLEQICYCPIAGPVKVTVDDGEVSSAVITEGGQAMKKGSDAPEYLWITINDVIARANDLDTAKVDVEWPDGQDWPRSVAVDQVENAVDDEVTYVISDVSVG